MTSSATSLGAVGAPTSSLRMLDDVALGQQIASALRARDPEEGVRLLGKYRIELRAESDEALDRFDATRMLDGRWVTVEMPTLAVCSDARQLERFTSTVHAELALRHKNVLAVLDTGVTEAGRPFAVREAFDTEPLLGLVARGEKLSWKRIRSIGLQLCGGVAVVRARGLQPCEISLGSCRRARQSQGIDEVKLVDLAPLAIVGRDEVDDVGAIVSIIEQLADVGGELASPPELEAIRARANAADPAQRFTEVMELGRALAAIGQGATAWSRAPASAAAGVIETAYTFARTPRSTPEAVEVSCVPAELVASVGANGLPAHAVNAAPRRRGVLPWMLLVGAVAAGSIYVAVPDAWPRVVQLARAGVEELSHGIRGLSPTELAATAAPIATTAIAPGSGLAISDGPTAAPPPVPELAITSALAVPKPIQTRSQAVPPAPTASVSARATSPRVRAKRGRVAEPRVTPSQPDIPDIEAAPVARPTAMVEIAAPEQNDMPTIEPVDPAVDPAVDLSVAPTPAVDVPTPPEHAALVPETPTAESLSEPPA
jgi:hypothetical protein